MNLPAKSSRLTARRLAFVAGLSLPLVFATGVCAQPAPHGPQSAGPPGAAEHHFRSPEDMAARHAARLRALLQLRPDQEPALTAFLASMKPAGHMMRDEHEGRSAGEALPAPERMERMMARMDEVRAGMSQKLEALKTFYGQLTPAQQKAFDALDMGHGRGQGRGGAHGMHGGGEHMHGMAGGAQKPGD